jgi:hypothetical protein
MQDDILKLAYEVSRVTAEKLGLIDAVVGQTRMSPLNARMRRRARARPALLSRSPRTRWSICRATSARSPPSSGARSTATPTGCRPPEPS